MKKCDEKVNFVLKFAYTLKTLYDDPTLNFLMYSVFDRQ